MKNALKSRSRADNVKERISKLKDRNLEVIQVEEETELISKKMKKFYKIYPAPSGRATQG